MEKLYGARITGHEPNALDVRGALKEAMAQLRDGRVASHTLAAELLLMHVLGRSRAWLYAHPEEALDSAAEAHYFELVAQRIGGTPTQYLTGRQEFWGLEFEVTPDVLIPRPETEHVVEVALAALGQGSLGFPLSEAGSPQEGSREVRASRSEPAWRLADVGTGSGCLAVALARELPAGHVLATDISLAALNVARRNAARHGVNTRIEFLQCNLLEAFLEGPGGLRQEALLFDLIVSNPPYVGRREAELLPREVREYEPGDALFGGEHGFEAYTPLVGQAEKLLTAGGMLVLELGYNALESVRALLDTSAWTNVSVTNDLAGIPRVMAARRAR
jgi:release factor glutamine methyltransferase